MNKKKSYQHKKFKKPNPNWDEELEPPGELPLSDNQDYRTKMHEKLNYFLFIFFNKIWSITTFQTGYYRDILTPGTMKLFGITERGITTK